MTNLESVLKSRDITLLTKLPLVIAMAFLVVMYGHELDHEESQRIEVFNLWCWKRQSLLDNKVIKPPKGNQS